MAISDLAKNGVLPRIMGKKLEFYITFSKMQKFQNFQKNGQYIVELYLDIWHAKFQVDMSIFGKHIAQKAYPFMTSFFRTAIFGISRHRTEIK